MKKATIAHLVNEMLAGERHTYKHLKPYLDKTIDDINQKLNSKFPAFSEVDDTDPEYNYFPDRYIRSVVLPGAAWHYFVTDEEGMDSATQYKEIYQHNIFLMSRDYFNHVPEEYQETDFTGLPDARSIRDGERGVTVDGTSIHPG